MPSYTVYLTNWAVNSSTGTAPWFNPGNAEYVDGSFAKTNGVVGSAITEYLVGTGPSPISPGAETIASILATVTRGSTGTTTDNVLALVVGGVVTTTNKAAGATWPSTLTPATYTWSLSDLQALGISLATVQQATFGVAISANLNNPTGAGATVDAIVLTVNTSYVCVPSGTNVIPPYGVR